MYQERPDLRWWSGSALLRNGRACPLVVRFFFDAIPGEPSSSSGTRSAYRGLLCWQQAGPLLVCVQDCQLQRYQVDGVVQPSSREYWILCSCLCQRSPYCISHGWHQDSACLVRWPSTVQEWIIHGRTGGQHSDGAQAGSGHLPLWLPKGVEGPLGKCWVS